jgi:hypothetical protein
MTMINSTFEKNPFYVCKEGLEKQFRKYFRPYGVEDWMSVNIELDEL